MLKPEEVQMQNMSLYAGNPQQAMYAAHHGNHMVRLFNRISNFLKLLGTVSRRSSIWAFDWTTAQLTYVIITCTNKIAFTPFSHQV
jgi:hypothetical protein